VQAYESLKIGMTVDPRPGAAAAPPDELEEAGDDDTGAEGCDAHPQHPRHFARGVRAKIQPGDAEPLASSVNRLGGTWYVEQCTHQGRKFRQIVLPGERSQGGVLLRRPM
jgi:hypothetical protein